MKQQLVIAFLAALCFGAGFAARMWTERGPSVPPPPTGLGQEFTRDLTKPGAGSKADPRPVPTAADNKPNRPQMISDIARLGQEIEKYQAQMEVLDGDFDRGLLALLTTEQKTKFAARQTRIAERRAQTAAADAAEIGPLTDDKIASLQQRSLFGVLWSVSIKSRYDRLNKDMQFTAEQEPRVIELYRQRREKFLALIDTIQAPSITLSQIAPQVKKLDDKTLAKDD